MAKKLTILNKWKNQSIEEIVAVKQLGERIGYGNMMSLASALWQLDLNEKHGLKTGAFIPTLATLMKSEDAEAALSEQQRRMKQIKKALK
jgi:hypothetical protein